MAKLTKVTFTANVDTYVKGDTHELEADELKRLDAYAQRWNIKNPYVKGDGASVDVDDTTTTVTTSNVPNGSKTARAAMASQGNVNSRSTTTIKEPTATVPEGDGGEQAAMTEGEVETSADVEPANNTVNEGGDTSDSQPAVEDEANVANTNQDEKEAAAQELPPVTDQPVTDEGKKPNTGTKANGNKKK